MKAATYRNHANIAAHTYFDQNHCLMFKLLFDGLDDATLALAKRSPACLKS